MTVKNNANNKMKFIGFNLRLALVLVILACILNVFTVNDALAADRAAIVINELKSYDAGIAKKNPAAIIEKYNKIAESPFSFYRGTAVLFYRDMADNSLSVNGSEKSFLTTGLSETYINGDMHIANFGFVRNSNNDAQFDANDFDESFIAPYIWDLKRAAASLCLHCRTNGIKADEEKAVEKFTDSFIDALKDDGIKKYAITAKNAGGFLKDNIKKLDNKKREDLLEKLTMMSEPNKFLKNDELAVISATDYDKIKEVFEKEYAAKVMKRFSDSGEKIDSGYFKVLDICEKLHSGTGSLGLSRYYILIAGKSIKDCSHNVVIEMKQQRNSVVSNSVRDWQKIMDSFKGNGRRVLLGTYAMASNVSPFVDFCELDGVQYTLREVSPQKSSVKLETLDLRETLELAEAAGKIYAKMFVKSSRPGDVSNAKKLLSVLNDESNIDEFKRYLMEFGVKYADMVENDYKIFTAKKESLINDINKIAQKSGIFKK